MSNKAIPTRPPSANEKILQDKFAESVAAQADLMDKLGQQLIALELAIPGLYATVLKLISGDKATLLVNPLLYLTFICWFLALLITLMSLIPGKWQVNPQIMRQDPAQTSGEIGIEDFFYRTAQYKRRWLITASLLFFAGVASAAFTVF